MQTLRIVLLVLFWLDSVLLVIAVLLQSGRGGGLAGALGGISSADSALGVRAASQIEKATMVFGAIFFILALSLAFVATRQAVTPGKINPATRGGIESTAPARTTPPAKTSTPSGVKATTPPAGVKATTPPAKAPAGRTATAPPKSR